MGEAPSETRFWYGVDTASAFVRTLSLKGFVNCFSCFSGKSNCGLTSLAAISELVASECKWFELLLGCFFFLSFFDFDRSLEGFFWTVIESRYVVETLRSST